MTVVSGVVAGVALLAGVLAAAATRVPSLERAARAAAVAVEALVVVFVVADLGLLLREGERPDDLVTHAGYAVAAVGLIPLLVFRRPPHDDPEAEVEPASLWVVVIALAAVAVCVVRLAQTR